MVVMVATSTAPQGSSRVVATRTHTDPLNHGSSTDLRPPPALAHAVDGYCDYSETTAGFHTRRELPHAEGVLIVNLGSAIAITGGDGVRIELPAGAGFIAGAHLRPAWSHSGGSQCGLQVRLPLRTLHALTGVPMDGLQDRVVGLEAVWSARQRGLLRALAEAESPQARMERMDALLLATLSTATPDPRVVVAEQLLRTRLDLDVAAVAEQVGWSGKHLRAQLQRVLGIGPRCFRRLLRFQRLLQGLTDVAEPDWAMAALNAGYCDQAHMNREFREFAQWTPGQYLRQRLPGVGVVEA